ncbi:MAG TPA: hypothetical protein VNG29_02850 [Candidatus Paceibacterota bacterium]|nr:hypothetical protein [Candidatus Paceibacterota bacterium]
MKKYIYIGIAVVVLVAIAAIISLFASKGGSAAPPASDSGQVASQIHPPDTNGFPTDPTITLGTAKGSVIVNNFYKLAVEQEENTLVFKKTDQYLLSYDTTNSSFWIQVSGTPFDDARKAAEADFLQTLGLSQADACKLAVSVGVPYSPGNALDGQFFPLSFCAQ